MVAPAGKTVAATVSKTVVIGERDENELGEGVHAASAERSVRPRMSRMAFTFSDWTGSVAFGVCLVALFTIWVLVGKLSHFPRWWELTVTIGVPMVSLLLLTIVQHTQSHANRVTQLKLGELIRASENATNRMITLEEASSSDLDRIHAEFATEKPE